MATPSRVSSTVMSLPLPSPKVPRGYPDLYGKRREMARVQMLEREISFLEEELKSSEGLQQASRCCKEIADFVMANSDPLLPTNKKNHRSSRFWKWLCRMPCFNMSWICCRCCDECSDHLKLPSCCCHCKSRRCSCSFPSMKCSLPKWGCCSGRKSHCCKENCGCKNCCVLPSCCNFWCPFPSCCSCKCTCSCSCSWPSCPKVRPCCGCTKSCWNSFCSCC